MEGSPPARFVTRRYAFGDTQQAANRLEVLAEVFEPSSRAFLNGAARRRVAVALDLGCGPGFTTHLLASAVRASRTIGLDNSKFFIDLAERTRSEGVSFVRHDVTKPPFPTGPADVAYCRFLLSHLSDPGAVVAAWATQLVPGGRLLIDEVEEIRTDVPAFRTYLEIVDAMLASEGRQLYVGPTLEALSIPGLTRVSTQVADLKVGPARAAEMFRPNLGTWRTNPFVERSYERSVLDELNAELGRVRDGSIEWGLRQIVFERE